MTTSTKITAVFLGKLGEAAQNSLSSEQIPAMEILTNLPTLEELLPDTPSLEEEVLLVVTEQEELTQGQLAKLLQRKQAGNVFTIVITVTSSNLERQQEILASVDSMIVLPATELASLAVDKELVNAIYKVITNLANLVIDSYKADVSVDFEDVKTVLRGINSSVVGIGKASGDNRAMEAANQAMSYPFMRKEQLANSSRVLLNIFSGINAELEMDELTDMTDAIQEACGDECEVIFGHGLVESLDTEIEVFLIATK